jgi:glycosyltransferase involved in cell wall biosynthesis
VLTSQVSSLPEVCGPGAVYVDPRSEAELTGAFARLIAGADLRQQLATVGRSHVAAFTWANAAKQSLRFFERIAG